MFGFYASTDKRFVKDGPVKIFSFASPIPGKISYAKAFQHQEYEGKLMHARIVIEGDMVPLARFALCRDFAQSGFFVEFPRDLTQPPIFKYLHDKDWWRSWEANIASSLFLNLPSCSLRSHSLSSFPQYLQASKETIKSQKIKQLSLEDHYRMYVISKKGEVTNDGPECIGAMFKIFYNEKLKKKLILASMLAVMAYLVISIIHLEIQPYLK